METFSPQLGLDMEELEEVEEDAGLGNGGLGRLAGEQTSSKPSLRMKSGIEVTLRAHSHFESVAVFAPSLSPGSSPIKLHVC